MKTVLLCFASVVGFAGPGIAQTVMMTQSDVEAAFSGKAFALTTQEGTTATIAFHRDLTALVTFNDGSTDGGTYRFAEGGYCSSWEKFREGVEACFTVESLGDARYQLYTLAGAKDDLFEAN
jgi:hypothetical protein